MVGKYQHPCDRSMCSFAILEYEDMNTAVTIPLHILSWYPESSKCIWS